MGEKSDDDYLTSYRKFFEYFASSADINDQLPVKVAGYNVAEFEISGEVVDWSLQYLTERRCPPHLLAPIIRTVLDEIQHKCKAQPSDCGYRPQKDDYQSLKLMKAATNQLIEVCKRYLNNAELYTLPPPPSAILQAPPVSACGVKNTRRTMEDRHIALQDIHTLFNIKGCGTASYYAIFDGHNGTDAAVYSVSHLHQFLVESPHYPDDPITALQDAFLKTDDHFDGKCLLDDLKSGTTAVCCLLRPKEHMLYVAWAGDSQAVLVKQGKACQVVKPHKPDRPDEKMRIEEKGGSVLFWGVWRVNGQIAVSRAIGDPMCKPYVIADPEIKAIPLDGTEDFIILGCDGLWDVVLEEQAMHAVYNYLEIAPGDLEGVSQRLVQLAKQEGSTDNISVVVVFLSEPSEVVKRRPMETASPSNPFHKQNGSDLYCGGAPNGSLNCYQEDDDFGPETDVDAVDDVLLPASSIAQAKALVSSNKDLQEDIERQRQESGELDSPIDSNRADNTPTPPAQDVLGFPEADNVIESGGEGEDSDDEEWNYYKGDDKQKSSNSLTKEELEDMESHLNPDAPEFVPDQIKTNNLDNDVIISSSPLEPKTDEIKLPSLKEFHKGIIECTGDFNRHNGIEPLDNGHIDEKISKNNGNPDVSEILSTKAEFGDDSTFNFSSMNTSSAFSTESTLDDNVKNVDPFVYSSKELSDTASTPELDDVLIPGTPRSTVAEASASPTNLDTSPSQFMGFEENYDNSNETAAVEQEKISDSLFSKENRETDIFGFSNKPDHEDDNEPEEPMAPLTFAEVLKRPSPRTSPEPPIEEPQPLSLEAKTEQVEEIKSTDAFSLDEMLKKSATDTANNVIHQDFSVEQQFFTEQNVLQDTNPFAAGAKDMFVDDSSASNSNFKEISNEFDAFNPILVQEPTGNDFVKQEDMQEQELGFMQDTSLSSFITVRETAPEDESPPNLFQVDETVKHFDDVENIKSFPHEELAEQEQSAEKEVTDNLQFMSTNSENESISNIIEESVLETKPVEVAPEELQFGTVNPNIELVNVANNTTVHVDMNNQIYSKDLCDIPECKELEVKENHFDSKVSPTEIRNTFDDFKISESHFVENSSAVTNGNYKSDFESTLDAQDLQFNPPSLAPIEPDSTSNNDFNQALVTPNTELDDTIVLKENEIPDVSDNFSILQNYVIPEVVLDDTSKTNVDRLVTEVISETVEESRNELFSTNLEPVNEKAAEQILDSVVNEFVEETPVDSLSSVPTKVDETVKQQETLEQTINVDFIPAEPLATPEGAKEEKFDAVPTVVPVEGAQDTIMDELTNDAHLSTETPPPTPAPGVVDKQEQNEGISVAAAAAAVAGAAVTVGAVAAKTAIKKSTTTTTTTKKPSATKKPTDLATKTTATKVSSVGKSAMPSKPLSARTGATKPATSTLSSVKSPPSLAAGAKATATKPAVKPSSPSSKPTTPTSSSRPSSTTKTALTKPAGTVKSTMAKPRVTTATDKKPLTNGEIKSAIKRTETVPKKPLASKPTPSLVKSAVNTSLSVTSSSRTAVTSTTRITSTNSTLSKPKTTTTTSSTLNKARVPATKPSDKTGKDTINKQISSVSSRTTPTKSPIKTTKSILKKTDNKNTEKGPVTKSPVTPQA